MENNKQAIKIKRATSKDINRFWNFFEKSVKKQFPEYPTRVRKFFLKKQYTKSHLKQCLREKTITLLIVLDNNEVVGYLIAGLPYGGIVSIIWLAVKDSLQRKGIGSALLKEYETIAKKKGIHKITLLVTNKENLKFYKKNGYKIIGYVPKNYFGLNDWWLYKEIQKPKIDKCISN